MSAPDHPRRRPSELYPDIALDWEDYGVPRWPGNPLEVRLGLRRALHHLAPMNAASLSADAALFVLITAPQIAEDAARRERS